MGGLIGALQRLQEVERQISRLRRQEDRKTQHIRTAERQVRRIDQDSAVLRTECERHQLELDRLDQDVKQRDTSILRHREELLRARTNKDYSAVLTAINTEKADSAKIEKLALEKLGEVERVQQELEARAKQQESVQQRLDAARQALDDYRHQTAEERNTLREQREAAATDLPPSILASFTRVAERHEGEALAEIIRLHSKAEEYACGGCNMQVPLDCFNTVRAGDEIRLCPSCGRILHLSETAPTGE